MSRASKLRAEARTLAADLEAKRNGVRYGVERCSNCWRPKATVRCSYWIAITDLQPSLTADGLEVPKGGACWKALCRGCAVEFAENRFACPTHGAADRQAGLFDGGGSR